MGSKWKAVYHPSVTSNVNGTTASGIQSIYHRSAIFTLRFTFSNKNLPNESLYVTIDNHIRQLVVSRRKNRQLILRGSLRRR